jgi:hypothetical protein
VKRFGGDGPDLFREGKNDMIPDICLVERGLEEADP